MASKSITPATGPTGTPKRQRPIGTPRTPRKTNPTKPIGTPIRPKLNKTTKPPTPPGFYDSIDVMPYSNRIGAALADAKDPIAMGQPLRAHGTNSPPHTVRKPLAVSKTKNTGSKPVVKKLKF